jgi:hypothetical protein
VGIGFHGGQGDCRPLLLPRHFLRNARHCPRIGSDRLGLSSSCFLLGFCTLRSPRDYGYGFVLCNSSFVVQDTDKEPVILREVVERR